MKRSVTAICLLVLAGCGSRPKPSKPSAASVAPTPNSFVGIYASPVETGGIAGTVLQIQHNKTSGLLYRMTSYSDVVIGDNPGPDIDTGSCSTIDNVLYISSTIAGPDDGNHYTRLTINKHVVLMRDDALETFRKDDKLYDYGILIQVPAPEGDVLPDLYAVKHPSIKVLYKNPDDPNNTWHDPFTHGPNSR